MYFFLQGGKLHEMTEVFESIEAKTSLLGIALDVEASSSSVLERSEYLSRPGRKKLTEAAEAAKQQTFKAATSLYKSIDKAKNMFWRENGEKVIPASYRGMNFEGLIVPSLVGDKFRGKIIANEFFELKEIPIESGSQQICSKDLLFRYLFGFGMVYLQIYPGKTIGFLQYCSYLMKMWEPLTLQGLLAIDNTVRKYFIGHSNGNWETTKIKSLVNNTDIEWNHLDEDQSCKHWNYSNCKYGKRCHRVHGCCICCSMSHRAPECNWRV